jgi:hypothetical protein
MGWGMREPYCPLSSAVFAKTFPEKHSQHYHLCEFNITITVYLIVRPSVTFYIIFLSRMRDWTVAVAQYSKFAC